MLSDQNFLISSSEPNVTQHSLVISDLTICLPRSPPDRFHGRGGPLGVTPEPKTGKLARGFLQAGIELGFGVVDPNAADQIGEYSTFAHAQSRRVTYMHESRALMP